MVDRVYVEGEESRRAIQRKFSSFSREYKRFWASESLCCWVGSIDECGLDRSALPLLLPLLLIAVEDHGNRFISDENAIKRVNTCME